MLKTLNQCYKNPSPNKVKIYHSLCEYAKSINAIEYGIEGYNLDKFTFVIKLKKATLKFTSKYAYSSINNKQYYWYFEQGVLQLRRKNA